MDKRDLSKALRTRKILLPDGSRELISMEQWYWTTLDWLTTNFEYTEETIMQLGLKHQQTDDVTEAFKLAIWVLQDSHEKVSNPDNYVNPFPQQEIDQTTYNNALRLLGVNAGFTLEELQKNYMLRLAKIHPDFMPEFNEAYEQLKKHCRIHTASTSHT